MTEDILSSAPVPVTSSGSDFLPITADTDWEGRVFTVLIPEQTSYEFDVGEMTGDIVSDAVYERTLRVEDMLDIRFNYIKRPCSSDSNYYLFNDEVLNSVLSGDGAIDLVNGMNYFVHPLVFDGCFTDINAVPYIDLSNPWWVSGMKENLSIKGRLYGVFGDASLSLYKDIYAVFFNAGLISGYNLQDPYKLVYNGVWTIDKMREMSLAAAADLNGDGVLDINSDLYGYCATQAVNRAFMASTETDVIGRNASGSLYIKTADEKLFGVYGKLYRFLSDKDTVSIAVGNKIDLAAPFIEGRCLFNGNSLYLTEYLRDLQIDWGIVPYPKYDEKQEYYHSQIASSTSALFIPVSAPDAGLTGMVCEAFAYYGFRDIVPAYYELALKDKYLNNGDAGKMVDLIRDTASTGFTMIYSRIFEYTPNNALDVGKIGSDYASFYTQKKAEWETELAYKLTLIESDEN